MEPKDGRANYCPGAVERVECRFKDKDFKKLQYPMTVKRESPPLSASYDVLPSMSHL